MAHVVWEYFGNPINYVDPFCGSLATLLLRPHEPRAETVNDKDCFVANFWRALATDPEEVAYWADWPVNEADLHSRHKWLVSQDKWREKMLTDPDFYDPQVAGWWVWGISQWIGGGWCVRPEWQGRYSVFKQKGIHVHQKRSDVRSYRGVHRKRANLKRSGVGVHRNLEQWQTRPQRRGNNGIHRQLPQLGGDGSGSGRGVHSEGIWPLLEYFYALAGRLRRTRVCCGDWKRIMGPSPTWKIGTTAVFLDPPYSEEAGRDKDLYAEEDLQVAHEVRKWAIENGSNKLLRIALCGYEGEHQMPDDWVCVAWKANGGYSNQRGGPGQENATKERIWFSPACLKPQPELFKL